MTAVFWGASFIASKIALRILSPAALTVARFGIGFVVIWLIVGPKTALRSFSRKDVPIFAVLGFFGVAVHQWLQTTGLKTAQATNGAWMVTTIPVYVALLSKLVLGERLGRRRSLGIFIAGAGAIVVLSRGMTSGFQQVSIGDI
ncbi:MAG: DMT family transporter [Chloroflexi bacterium]|nr:DMT family transporter [Chloroflexota bacterium]